MTTKTTEELIEKLRDITATARVKGTADYDRYLHGMANGLTLALHIMEDSGRDDCPYLEWGEADPPGGSDDGA